jgi:diacylglycerol kinase family enzyme
VGVGVYRTRSGGQADRMPAATDVLVVANEKAGGSGEVEVARVAAEIGRGARVEVATTCDQAELDAALDALAGRTLAVVGGDGSLHTVVRRLWDRGELTATDLALVPLGTGNDFARTVGIPLDAAEAAAALAGYQPGRLDLVIDSDQGGRRQRRARRCRRRRRRARVGAEGPARSGGVPDRGGRGGGGRRRLGRPSRGRRRAVRRRRRRVLMVAVCNGRTIGGGTVLCEHADPADGLLDVVVVTATDPGARLGFGNDLRKGTHLDRGDVCHVRGQQLSIVSEPIGYNADGELGDPVDSKTFRIEPGAWTLRRPA